MADASDDDFIEGLEDKFGLMGYARWWKMLEIIAKSMDKNRNDPTASHSIEKWCSLLKAKRKVLISFLEYSQNKTKIKWKQNDNIIEITCANILKMRDEYSRKSGHTPENVAPDTETEKEIESKRAVSAHAGAVYSAPKSDEEPIGDFQKIYDTGTEIFPDLVTASTSFIQMWIENDYDVEKDIIPEIKRQKGRDISSWKFFNKAIASAHKNRTASPPEISEAPVRRRMTYSEEVEAHNKKVMEEGKKKYAPPENPIAG